MTLPRNHGSIGSTTTAKTSYPQKNIILILGVAAVSVLVLGTLTLISVWLLSKKPLATDAAMQGGENVFMAPSSDLAPPDASGQESDTVLQSKADPQSDSAPSDATVASSETLSEPQAELKEQTMSSDTVADELSAIFEDAPQLEPYYRLSLPPLPLEPRVAEQYYSERSTDPTDFSLDFNSGTLAVIGPWEKAIGFITQQQFTAGAPATDPTTVKLPGQPSCVEFKPLPSGGVFLVGYSRPGGVAFIDSETFEVFKRIPFECEQIASVSCALDPNATEAYLFERVGTHGTQTFRLNTHEMKIDAHWPKGLSGTVSKDGKTVFTRKRGPIQPSPDESFDWDPIRARLDGFKIDSARYDFKLDPRGRFITCGIEVYPPECDQKLIPFEFEATAFSMAQPWMAGIDREGFVVGSINTGKVTQRVNLPKSWRPTKYRPKLKHHTEEAFEVYYKNAHGEKTWAQLVDCEVFADDRRNQFILAHSGHVFCFPYQDLQLPNEPDLWLTTTTPKTGYLGQALQFDLETTAQDIVIELEAPEGDARIEGQTFHWTPTTKGLHTFNASIKKGDTSHPITWTTDVDFSTVPRWDIPFYVTKVDVSFDESKMLVFGYAEKPRSDQPLSVRTPKLAIVDLGTREIAVENNLMSNVTDAILCKDEILLPRKESDLSDWEITRLNVSDLSIAGQATIPEGNIQCVADRFVAVKDGWDFELFSIPTLKLVRSYRQAAHADWNGRRLADGWTTQGVLWDHKLKSPQMIFDSAPISALNFSMQFGAQVKRVYTGYILDQLATVQPNHAFNRETRYDCNVLPAHLQLELTNDYLTVKFTDIENGEMRHETVLETRKTAEFYRSSDTPHGVADWTNHEVFVVWNGKLYPIDLTPIRDKFPRPFHIKARQSTFILKGQRPIVSYQADGATDFKLEFPHIDNESLTTLESSDGKVELALPDVDELAPYACFKAVGRDGNDVARLKRYLELATPQYQLIAGSKPTGVPLALPVRVTATGPNAE